MINPTKLPRHAGNRIAAADLFCRRLADRRVPQPEPRRADALVYRPGRRLRQGLAGLIAGVCVAGAAPMAEAQAFIDVGTRAQGMAGAFVAVADDATATWWNPAGLAGGALFSAVLERGLSQTPDAVPVAGAAARTGTFGVALAYPALGLSFYRFRVSDRGQFDSIGVPEPSRQDRGQAPDLVRSVGFSAFGLTVGQSVGDHLVVASTLRLVRAGSAFSEQAEGADVFDRAEDLSIDGDTAGDLDIGVMARFGGLSAGGTLRHVGQPGFGDGPTRLVLKRQMRIGMAFRKGKLGVFDSLVAAVDADMTTAQTVFGAQRQTAVGGEAGVFGNRVLLRGGMSRNVEDTSSWRPSTGASVGVRSGVYLDGAYNPNPDESEPSRAGWSVSLRALF